MNWNRRYAAEKKTTHCVFCHGINHLYTIAKGPQIHSLENSFQIGLPRPYSDLRPDVNWMEEDVPGGSGGDDIKPLSEVGLGKGRYPVPYAAEPNGGSLGGPPVPSWGDNNSINEHRCPMCGDRFSPLSREEVIRWAPKESDGNYSAQGSGGRSDIFPFHPKCMRQVRKFCPAMQPLKDTDFEVGPYSELRENAEKHLALREVSMLPGGLLQFPELKQFFRQEEPQ